MEDSKERRRDSHSHERRRASSSIASRVLLIQVRSLPVFRVDCGYSECISLQEKSFV